MSADSAAALFKPLLAPAAFFYGLVGSVRASMYDAGLLQQGVAPQATPIISVGNITVGGTGKTPVVIDLAQKLSAASPVSILSRGYARRSSEKIVIASAGQGPLVSSAACGDEPYLMARSTKASVIVGASRLATSSVAVEKFAPAYILLDDGFQHRPIKRDLDIVLYDFNDDIDGLSVLPAGRLREPLTGLKRADIIVITKIPQAADFDASTLARIGRLQTALKKYAPQAVSYLARFRPDRLTDWNGSTTLSLDVLRGKKVVSMCAIARPESFQASLQAAGASIVDSLQYPDHHWFDARDWREIAERFSKSGADYLVTTEKDLVRLDFAGAEAAFAREAAALKDKTLALGQSTEWLDVNGLAVDFVALMLGVLQSKREGGGHG